jgi:CHASE3 domain sensor protein
MPHLSAVRDSPENHRTVLGAPIPLPVGLQVLAGVGSILVFFVASILVAVFLVLRLTDSNRHHNTHVVPFSIDVEEASLAAKGAANDSRGFLISGRRLYIDEFTRRVADTHAALGRAFRHASTATELRLIAEARSGFDTWVHATRREFVMFRRGDRPDARAASLASDRATRKRYEATLTRVDLLAEAAIRSSARAFTGASERAVMILLACLLAALTLGLCTTIWIVRTILKPVYALLRIFAPREASGTG